MALHAINTGVLTKTVTSFIVLGLLLGVQNPGVAQSQTELTAQACGEFKKADSELNKVFQQILAANAGNAAFVKALREAQRAWITFRDAHVTSIYPDPDPMAYGTVNPMCRCSILGQLTVQRSKQLRQLWIEGTVEGDSCAGSSAVKRGNNSNPPRKK
jgi:uncharacterized protein YecT (DUF1311 family)